MTRSTTLLLAGCFLMGAAPGRADTGGAKTDEPPAEAMSAKLITASAKVDKVDAKKRELTLKDENSTPFTISVPEGITRLDNVKPGDRIQVSFYESVAVSLAKAGEKPTQQQTTSVRTPGALPSGQVSQQITTNAKITKINTSTDELTIEGPEGKATTLRVGDKSQLGNLKVGDNVQATYTQAMATQVTPARRM
jgi:Cu/Ag efflux protein CusF